MGKDSAAVEISGAYVDRVNFLKLMMNESNERHKLTLHDISIRYKKARYNEPSRNTLLKIIDEFHSVIMKCRVDNEGNPTKEMYYYYKPDKDELTEEDLAVMLQAVLSLHCIDATTKDSIAENLLSKTNKYFADTYRKLYSVHKADGNTCCVVNKNIVNTIIEALKSRKRIQFNYYKLTYEKQKRRSSGKDTFEVEPIMMNIDNGFLYLIAHKAGVVNEGRRIYRVDRMDNVRITDDIVGNYTTDLSDFKRSVFYMFTGRPQTVQFECHEELASSMVDKFGDFKLISSKSPNFVFETTVEISETFYSWLTTFGDKIKIIAPEEEVRSYKTFLQKILAKY